MRSETKLVKTASRSALAGGSERDRLLDDCRTPEIGWLVSHNRPGLASASPDSLPRRDGRPAHDDSKTQQLRRFSFHAGELAAHVRVNGFSSSSSYSSIKSTWRFCKKIMKPR